MRILMIGGSGYLGTLTLPWLAEHHQIRVLDLVPPQGDHDHVVGSANDPAVLATALDGMDAVVHAAMGRRSEENWPHLETSDAFQVNVESIYTTLQAAHAAGVSRAVVIGSLSVFGDERTRLVERDIDESMEPDATDLYGATKRLGEQVARIGAEEYAMTVTLLRIAFPTPDDVWPRWALPIHDEPLDVRRADGTRIPALAGSDMAAAMAAAAARDAGGYDVFHILGTDEADGKWSRTKARDVLGWEPRRR